MAEIMQEIIKDRQPSQKKAKKKSFPMNVMQLSANFFIINVYNKIYYVQQPKKKSIMQIYNHCATI